MENFKLEEEKFDEGLPNSAGIEKAIAESAPKEPSAEANITQQTPAEKIEKIESAAAQDLPGMVPSSIREAREKDLEELRGSEAPSEVAKEVGAPSEEIKKIDEEIDKIKQEQGLNLPGGVPSAISEPREKDMKRLEEERAERIAQEALGLTELGATTEKGIAEIEKMSEVVKTPEEIKLENENRLIDIAKQIESARGEKDRAKEDALNIEAANLFNDIKGEDLEDKVKNLAKVEAEKEGGKIMTIKEFMSPERIKNTEEKVQQRQWSDAIKYRWEGLAPEEQAKYVDENGSPNKEKFAMYLDSKLEGLNKELAKQGLNISKDAYYKMMEQSHGLEPEKMKVRGFWGRLFGGAVEVPIGKVGKMSYSKAEFGELVKQAEEGASKQIKEKAQEILEGTVHRGQLAWRRRKGRHMGDVLNTTIEEIKKIREAPAAKEIVPAPTQDFEEMVGRENQKKSNKEKNKKRKTKAEDKGSNKIENQKEKATKKIKKPVIKKVALKKKKSK